MIFIVLFVIVTVGINGLVALEPPIYLILFRLLDPLKKPQYKVPFNANNIPPQQDSKSVILIFIYSLFTYENSIDFSKKVLFDNWFLICVFSS